MLSIATNQFASLDHVSAIFVSVKVGKFEKKSILIFYYIKQIDSMLPCICSVIDHRGRQNVVRISVTHSAAPCVPPFCSYHIDIVCDLLLNRRTATWNLFVNLFPITS